MLGLGSSLPYQLSAAAAGECCYESGSESTHASHQHMLSFMHASCTHWPVHLRIALHMGGMHYCTGQEDAPCMIFSVQEEVCNIQKPA